MLDNRNSGLDPSFIDQAWEDMRRQLDEAMPVESKKRRILAWWWWAAALLLPTLIGIGLYSRAQAPTLDTLPIPGPSKAIAVQPSIQQLNTQNPSAEGAQQSTLPTISSNPIPAISKTSSTPNQSVLIPAKPEQEAQSSRLVQGRMPNPEELNEATEPLDVIGIPIEEKHPIGSNTAPTVDRQLLPELEAIPTGLAFEIPGRDLSLGKEVNASRLNTRYAVEVGTSTRSFLTLDGFNVGVNKEWQKTGSRWTFGAGIHYRQQLIPFETSDLLKVKSSRDAADQMDSPVLEESFNSGSFASVDFSSGVARFVSGDSSINVPVNSLNLIQRLHYIDVPTYASLKLGRRWETFASVRFSFLAKAHLLHTHRPVSRATEDFAFNNVGSGGQLGNYAYQLASNTSLGTNTDNFQRFMLSGAMGFTYYPTPQIGWRLQYSSTPVSLYKIGSINTRDHWLGTSIIWRFGGK